MRLATWMEQGGHDDLSIAAKLGESPHTVKKWRLGYTAPTRRKMPAVARMTGNRVTANDFIVAKPKPKRRKR